MRAIAEDATDLLSFLRHTETPLPIDRSRSSQSNPGKKLHASNNTLTIGKNKVYTSFGESNLVKRSFTDPVKPRSTRLESPVSPASDETIQLSLWFHELRAYSEDVVIANAIPGLKENKIYELEPASNDEEAPKKFIFMIQKQNMKSKEKPSSPSLQPTGPSKTKTNFQISLLANPLQNLLDIPPRSLVQVRQVREISTVELDAVEIFIKDVNFGRDSQWSLSSSLIGTCCYAEQRVSYLGSRIGHVHTVLKDGVKQLSGYIGHNTSVIFRSESARLVFLVQISREMWHFEENGEIMFHKLINSLFPKIFKKWRAASAHHSITIVLFTTVDLTNVPWTILGGGERPNKCQEYYRVVVDQVSVFIWDKIMASLRLEFANFKRDILMHLNKTSYEIIGEPCPSVKGNVLEALNLSLTLLCDRFRNTDLRHSINNIILVTPGTGLFDVDHDMMTQVSRKMLQLDCALDILCLSQPPLHTVPLFRFRDPSGKVSHCVPKWCDVSFFSDITESSQWIPRCKIYELQMMGVMENDVNDVRIDRLNVNPNMAMSAFMDEYDDNIFAPVQRDSVASFASVKLKRSNMNLPKDSQATLSLMGKIPQLKPAINVQSSTTTSSAVGTVTHFEHAALSSLYSLNKTGDENRGSMLTLTRRTALPVPVHHRKSSVTSQVMRGVKKIELELKNSPESARLSRRIRRKRELDESVRPKPQKQPLHSSEGVSEVNQMWMTVANPSKQSNSDVIRFTRWADIFPRNVRRKTVKWRSLKAPAALPICTPIFPTLVQLETDYKFQIYTLTLNTDNRLELKTTKELMREMIRLRLAMGFQICWGDKVNRAEAERKPSGSPDCLIKHFPKGDCSGARIFMSLDEEIHRIFCDYNNVLNIQLYKKQQSPNQSRIQLGVKQKEPKSPLIRTRYTDVYTPTAIQPDDVKPSMFNWNQFDQLLAGYDDSTSELEDQFHKMKFVVVPTDMPQNANYVNNESLTEEEVRVEGLRKLIAYIEKGRYERTRPSGKKEEILPEISFYTGNLYEFLSEQADFFDISGTQPLNSLMVSDRFNTNIRLASLAQELQSQRGLNLVNRTWHFKTHAYCFLGSELVSWLIESFEDINNRDEAVSYGQTLMEKGLFKHVENRHRFLDGHYFYEFQEEYLEAAPPKGKRASSWFRNKADDAEKSSASPNTFTHGRKGSDNSDLSELNPLVSGSQILVQQLDSENSSLNDSQKAKKSKKFMITKHLRYNCDPQKKSFRPEIIDVHYDRVHNPEHCYHIRLRWLNTTTKFIDEVIQYWSRICERYGLKLVETPWLELCMIPKLNPFHSFVDMQLAVNPLNDPEFQDCDILRGNRFYFHLYFLQKSEFLLDNRGTSFFSKDNIKVEYSWGLSTFKYAQFIHKTGTYIVELRDNGDFFMAPNNVHILRANTQVTSLSELSQSVKNIVLDSQKVMLTFRTACKDEAYLRQVFREAKQHIGENYGADFSI